MWDKKLKFKVGDLVIIKEVECMFGYSCLEEGTVGIITGLLFGDQDVPVDSYFFDYSVLVGGKEYLLFEEEMRPYYAPCGACECDPCDCDWGLG